MTYDQVETFLSVVAHGTITAAANGLFISQSAVSTRLAQLEEELGAPLLVRGKGHRGVELTPFGNSFIPLASQWATLWKDTVSLKDVSKMQTLTIASVDAVNNYTMVPLHRQMVDHYPDVHLRIHTHHSNEIHGLVQNRTADIGFVFSSTRYPDIVSKPVYRELMYLICHKDSPYHDEMPCEELEPEKEIYLPWGTDYEEWHNYHWGQNRQSLMEVNTGSVLQHHLTRPGHWTVAPMSVVHEFSHNEKLTYYTLKEPPMPRICYMLTNRYPNAHLIPMMKAFEEELLAFVEKSSDICSFEKWMLSEDGSIRSL